MTSNNLQCEVNFYAEANSPTKQKFNLLSVNKVFVWHV